jgi:glycosyltransferase involved in cell wall biosynthesis
VSAADPRGPDVSVVIPTRDRMHQLRLSLRSALAQRDVDLEIIVVDDGSEEAAAPTVEALADARVRVVRNARPLGEAEARNRGIETARGAWIAFLDDDDLWSPSKLAWQRTALGASARPWAYGGHVTIDAGLDVVSGSPPPAPDRVISELTRYNAVPGSASSVIVAAEALADVGGFDPTLRRTTDWDMWLRLARLGLPAWVDRPVVALSEHHGNVSRDMDSLFGELPIIAARHGIEIDLARHHRWAAWVAARDGRRVDALRHYFRATVSGDVASVGRALVTLSARPTSTTRPTSRWVDEARAWLDPLKRYLDAPGGA